jgi:hypothetical protein
VTERSTAGETTKRRTGVGTVTPPDNVLLIHAREGEKLLSLGRVQVEGALSDLERLRHDVVSSVGPVSSDTNTVRPSINRTR